MSPAVFSIRASMIAFLARPGRAQNLEAAQLMLERHVGGLPVVDCGRLVGVITRADLVARLVRRERTQWWRVLVDHERLARECQRASGSTVGEVMDRPAIAVAAGDAVEVAAELLDAHAIGRLPVLDHGHVVGIVTRSDVLRAFGRGRPTRRCPDAALPAQLRGRGPDPVRLGLDRSSEAGVPGGP
jgi:CBS domain-containing protein